MDHLSYEDVDPDQQSLDFGDAARLEAHLVRCGLSRVQCRLAALVLAAGERRPVGEELRSVLSIGGREAAGRLGCTRQAVHKAAVVLQRHEWFRVARSGQRTVYILDDAAARSLVPVDQRLDELTVAAAERLGGPATGNHLQPGATGGNRGQPQAVSRSNQVYKTRVLPRVNRVHDVRASGCRWLPMVAGGW